MCSTGARKAANRRTQHAASPLAVASVAPAARARVQDAFGDHDGHRDGRSPDGLDHRSLCFAGTKRAFVVSQTTHRHTLTSAMFCRVNERCSHAFEGSFSSRNLGSRKISNPPAAFCSASSARSSPFSALNDTSRLLCASHKASVVTIEQGVVCRRCAKQGKQSDGHAIAKGPRKGQREEPLTTL